MLSSYVQRRRNAFEGPKVSNWATTKKSNCDKTKLELYPSSR